MVPCYILFGEGYCRQFYNTDNHTLYVCVTNAPKHITKKLSTYDVFTILESFQDYPSVRSCIMFFFCCFFFSSSSFYSPVLQTKSEKLLFKK